MTMVRTAPASAERPVFFPSMGEYPVYDDGVYDGFDAVDERCHAYRTALRRVAPGKVVLDVGTGRDALWAIESARRGARHVYAIEAQAEVAAQARLAVSRAGMADRITVITGSSMEVELPEPAEVCVSEIVGNIASAEGALAVLADARARLCAADCAWVPFRMQTWAVAVDLTRAADDIDYAIATESVPYLRKIFTSVGHPFDVRLCLAGPVHDIGVSSAAPVESAIFDSRQDMPTAEATTMTDLRVDVPAARLTGLLLWSRVAVLSQGPEIDTLTSDTRSWAPVYVPLSLPGIPVDAGGIVRVSFRRRLSDDGVHPDYEVSIDLPGATGVAEMETWSSRHHGRQFRASPFYRYLFPAT
ncbi:hypothetical protein [Dactylosporangium sp. NPDC048998]|uniref:hypothetical protein n=1 Tax=Dactylosporangium sp. NPDC048998 TaxID=3363976 RepID=UPI003717403B